MKYVDHELNFDERVSAFFCLKLLNLLLNKEMIKI